MEQCANCDALIGRLEPRRQWQGHVVCAACYERLAGGTPSPARAPDRPAPRPPAGVPTRPLPTAAFVPPGPPTPQVPQVTQPPPAVPVAVEALEYQRPMTAADFGPRPAWVYAIAGIYAAAVVGFLALPLIAFALGRDAGDRVIGAAIIGAYVAFFAILGWALMKVPYRGAWQQPIVRRSITGMVTGSSVCLALLGLGMAGTFVDFFDYREYRGEAIATAAPMGMLVATAVAWVFWLVVFGKASRSLDPASLSARIYKLLVLGSAVELLVAIPMHIAVRRRNECCAGVLSLMGICMGTSVMLVALGPGVIFLFYRRYQQAYAPHAAARRRRRDAGRPTE